MPVDSTVSDHTTAPTDAVDATTRVLDWLRAGYSDFRSNMLISVLYGVAFVLLSWGIVIALWLIELEWMLLPAVAGALLVGPLVAVGLYQISRRGGQSDSHHIASPGQIGLIGGVLMILLLSWIRAATIIFAIFFGLKPFPGFLETLSTLFFTPEGLALIVVGTAVGGLFASLTFAITMYSIPMLVSEEVDAFTAMGRSFSMCLKNMDLTIRWGAVVTILATIGFLSGLIGMVFVFPLLGYATWHAYRDMFGGI